MTQRPALDTLGKRIAQSRRLLAVDLRRDITPADLAKMLDTNPANIYRWEADEKVPREETLLALSSLFNVSVAYLRYGVTDASPPPPLAGMAKTPQRPIGELETHATKKATRKQGGRKAGER